MLSGGLAALLAGFGWVEPATLLKGGLKGGLKWGLKGGLKGFCDRFDGVLVGSHRLLGAYYWGNGLDPNL